MTFKNDRQRKAVMARLSSDSSNTCPIPKGKILTIKKPKPGIDPFTGKRFKHKRIEKSFIQKVDSIIKDSMKDQRLNQENRNRLNQAKRDLKQADTTEKLELWVSKHGTTVKVLTGLSVATTVVGGVLNPVAIVGPRTARQAIVAGRFIKTGFVGATVSGAGLGLRQLNFCSKKAQKFSDTRPDQVKRLTKKGFSKDQANVIVDSRIIRAEHLHRQSIFKKTQTQPFLKRTLTRLRKT